MVTKRAKALSGIVRYSGRGVPHRGVSGGSAATGQQLAEARYRCSPSDVPLLVAEVQRLQRENEILSHVAQFARRAVSGDGSLVDVQRALTALDGQARPRR